MGVDTTVHLADFNFDSSLCTGAYAGVGWPFKFKARHPDSVGPGEKADIEMSVENKIQGGAQGACGVGGNNAFEAFAGIKAGVTPELHIRGDKAKDAVRGWVADLVKKYLPDLPTIDLGPQTFGLEDLVSWLTGIDTKTYLQVSWGDISKGSPMGMPLPSLSQPLGPWPIPLPPIPSWVASLNLGLQIGVTPTAQDITGTPYADNNAHMANPSPSGQITAGHQANLDPNFEPKFSVVHQMQWSSQWRTSSHSGSPPPRVDFGIMGLDQDVVIQPWLQPSFEIGILANLITIPINLPSINLPSATLSLGGGDLSFHGMDRSPGLPDLVVSQISVTDLTKAGPPYTYDQVVIHAVAQNKSPAASAGYDGYRSFTVYDNNVELAYVKPDQAGECASSVHMIIGGGKIAPGTISGGGATAGGGAIAGGGKVVPGIITGGGATTGGGGIISGGGKVSPGSVVANVIPDLDPGGAWGCDVWKGQFKSGGTHVIKVCVNPEKDIEEADFTNNCTENTIEVLQALLPRFDWSISISPGSRTTPAGQFTTYDVSVTWAGTPSPTPQYVSKLDIFSWLPSVPSGVSYGFSGSHGPIPFSSALTIATSAQTPAGTYTITVVGDDGISSHTASATLIVQAPPPPPQTGGGGPPPPPPPAFDFSISASPTSGSAYSPSGSASYTISVTLTKGSPQPVTLSVSGCPQGASCGFSSSPIGQPTFTATLKVTVSKSTPLSYSGYTITVQGTGGGVTRSVTVTLYVIVPK